MNRVPLRTLDQTSASRSLSWNQQVERGDSEESILAFGDSGNTQFVAVNDLGSALVNISVKDPDWKAAGWDVEPGLDFNFIATFQVILYGLTLEPEIAIYGPATVFMLLGRRGDGTPFMDIGSQSCVVTKMPTPGTLLDAGVTGMDNGARYEISRDVFVDGVDFELEITSDVTAGAAIAQVQVSTTTPEPTQPWPFKWDSAKFYLDGAERYGEASSGAAPVAGQVTAAPAAPGLVPRRRLVL